jgi:predicted small lipoprotein YifL
MKQACWIFAVSACVAVAGCGQKGPLYLPDKNASVVTRPANSGATTSTPQAQPAPAPADATSGSATPNGGNTPPATPAPSKPPQDQNGDGAQSGTPKS